MKEKHSFMWWYQAENIAKAFGQFLPLISLCIFSEQRERHVNIWEQVSPALSPVIGVTSNDMWRSWKCILIQSVFQWPWRWASLFLSQSFSDKWLTTAAGPYGNFRLLNCLTTDTINIQILAVELEKKKKKEETTLIGLEIISPELTNKFTHRLIL